MARYALVIDGQVIEERNYDTPPPTKYRDGQPLLRPIQVVTAVYNPETQTYTVSRQVQNLKVVDTWVVSDLPRETIDVRLSAALAAHRYQVETAGITFSGMTVLTDDRSKLMINGALAAAQRDQNFTTKWKTQAGFVTLNAAQIIAVADAVAAHVSSCFEAEATVSGNIANYTTSAEVITAFDVAMAA